MKKPLNPALPEDKARPLLLKCIVCQKPCEGWYGRHGDKGTCSKACEQIQIRLPKYSGFEEEDYLRRLGETFDENPDIINLGE